jgi:fluoride exporter
MIVLLVALGAAVGAPLRYLVDRAVQAHHDSLFPWGTFAVNAAGSFLLGGLATTTLTNRLRAERPTLVVGSNGRWA